MRLALELHDGVLNRMAVLSLNLDPTTVSPRFREAYDELTRQLREIVSSLRPPMLQYGLKPACEELSYNLIERGNGRVKIVADIQAGEDRYPENIELHIYRILQEASENALQHAHAATIKIDVRLEPHMIAVAIEDDGVGFEMGDQLDLEELLARKHFGLAGMVERCGLIGAEMRILSSPQKGVQLHITWTQDMNSWA
jgi:signal transduction histidine kinase